MKTTHFAVTQGKVVFGLGRTRTEAADDALEWSDGQLTGEPIPCTAAAAKLIEDYGGDCGRLVVSRNLVCAKYEVGES